jgi:SAM-dependent methyltransferase
MTIEYPSVLWSVLSCPYCKSRLIQKGRAAECTGCERRFGRSSFGQLDLRLDESRPYPLVFEVGSTLASSEVDFGVLSENPAPAVDWKGVDVPRHLNSEMLSWFPRASHDDSMVLDLGCGRSPHRNVCEHAGFTYVGLDYSSEQAPLLGDAHLLPFDDSVFEFVLSVAVLEHVRFPFCAMAEVFRVLKPGGSFIGTVAFLEPFHSDSFYHHTHLGVLNCLDFAGFSVQAIAPSKDWSVLSAQAPALFPVMPRWLSRWLVLPLEALHRVYLLVINRLLRGFPGRRSPPAVVLPHRTTGAFTFITCKPGSARARRRVG